VAAASRARAVAANMAESKRRVAERRSQSATAGVSALHVRGQAVVDRQHKVVASWHNQEAASAITAAKSRAVATLIHENHVSISDNGILAWPLGALGWAAHDRSYASASVGLACRPVGAWRRPLVKRTQRTRNHRQVSQTNPRLPIARRGGGRGPPRCCRDETPRGWHQRERMRGHRLCAAHRPRRRQGSTQSPSRRAPIPIRRGSRLASPTQCASTAARSSDAIHGNESPAPKTLNHAGGGWACSEATQRIVRTPK
jgi:hypothetical protein